MEKNQLVHLIKQYLNRSISEEGLSRLQEYMEEHHSDEELLEAFDAARESRDSFLSMQRSENLFANIISDPRVKASRSANRTRWKRIALLGLASAACILLFIISGLNTRLANLINPKVELKTAITPGGNKATILLENGSTIELEDLKTDSAIHFKGYSIRKTADGNIAYLAGENSASTETIYNTIFTPRGGEYRLTLPDGTQVMLNASSKLKYPIRFDDEKRLVELSGEAYFDVVKKTTNGRRVPFIVQTGDLRLEVLGTQFNIKNYRNEIETTLVEGAVKLHFSSKDIYTLKPNQQAVYNGDPKAVRIADVDPYYSIAWKNGSFAFDQVSIYEVMESIARWYDVDVDYIGDLSDVYFSGQVSRFEDINKLLNTIALTGSVSFKTEGRRVLVMK